MPIPFQPKPRTVVYCDFSGYTPPEMIKRRPVVALAAHKRNAKLVAVIPLSTTRPNPVEEHHFQLLQNPLADSVEKEALEVLAECDMVAVVSTKRLELRRTGRRLSNGSPVGGCGSARSSIGKGNQGNPALTSCDGIFIF
jgi:mRNA interferase MazF